MRMTEETTLEPDRSRNSTEVPAEVVERPAEPTLESRGEDPIAIASRVKSDPVELLGPPRPSTSRGDQPIPNARATTGVLIRTARELERALQEPAPGEEPLQLAAGTDLELSPRDLRGPAPWIIQGPDDPDAPRPRIRFRPDPPNPQTQVRPVMFRIHPGATLTLRGIDIVLEQADAPLGGRWAAFGVEPGGDLELAACTVTIEGDHRSSAVVAIQEAEEPSDELDDEDETPAAASVKATDSFLRGGGDLIDIAAGQPLDLRLSNVVVSTGGSLAHGHGLSRDARNGAEPITLMLDLRRLTTRNGGGLVQLESAPGEPVLPVADVVVRDSILATAPGVPLLSVDGQEDLESLRDRIRWESHSVAYHQIDIYRRDQTAQPGNIALSFRRPSWDIAVGQREDSPYHGDLILLNPWDESLPAWTRSLDDVRLDPESPGQALSPDLSRIPNPPSFRAK